MIGIYCLLSVINDKVYIGQSRNIERRIKQHISDLTNSRHYNQHLQRAFDKYGLDNFIFSPMLECDENKLDYYEVKYISDFDSTNPNKGYNLDSGGNKNKKPSEETAMKIREAFKGENHPYYGTGALDKVGGVQFIKSEIAKGNTQEAIAKKAGVTRKALYNYLEVRNISWQDLGGRSKTDGKLGKSVFEELGGIDFIKAEIRKGKTKKKIAMEAGVSSPSLDSYLKIRNYSWTGLGGTPLGKHLRESIFHKKGGIPFIKSEIRKGKQEPQIAREANVSQGAISGYIRRRGYTWNELKEEAFRERG